MIVRYQPFSGSQRNSAVCIISVAHFPRILDGESVPSLSFRHYCAVLIQRGCSVPGFMDRPSNIAHRSPKSVAFNANAHRIPRRNPTHRSRKTRGRMNGFLTSKSRRTRPTRFPSRRFLRVFTSFAALSDTKTALQVEVGKLLMQMMVGVTRIEHVCHRPIAESA